MLTIKPYRIRFIIVKCTGSITQRSSILNIIMSTSPTHYINVNQMLTTGSPNKPVLMSKENIASKNFKSVISQAMNFQAQPVDFQMHMVSFNRVRENCGPRKMNPLSCLRKLKECLNFSEFVMLSF